MRLIVEMHMDNDAFAEDAMGEARRILADALRNLSEPGDVVKLRDINGNTTGYAKIEGER